MQVEIPPYGRIKTSVQRAYSISSAPSGKNEVEFLIWRVPGGIVTTYIHDYLKEGDSLNLIGPFGDFERTEDNSVMVCVAGGSGMAPFKSILLDMYESNDNQREVWYFFGARTAKDMYYLKEMSDLKEKLPNFHFVPSLSETLETGSGKVNAEL